MTKLAKPRGLRNNNPGNIEHNPRFEWQGEVAGGDRRFAAFSSMACGIRALAKNAIAAQEKHDCDTVRKLIRRWAPPHENDTVTYIRRVALALGVGADDRVNLRDRATLMSLVWAISAHENGPLACEKWLKPADVEAGVTMALDG